MKVLLTGATDGEPSPAEVDSPIPSGPSSRSGVRVPNASAIHSTASSGSIRYWQPPTEVKVRLTSTPHHWLVSLFSRSGPNCLMK